jgi:demethylmacrocin O-methyltransferase
MKKLTKIGLETGTDKATYHNFTEIYDDIFKEYTSPRILEIGVYNFSSILMYKKYFKNPYIVAMDKQDKSNYLDSSWRFVKGDQSNINDLKKCTDGELLFDIVIDDGGHTMKQQQISFGYLLDFINPGGYYIIEDLHTSFHNQFIDRDCEITTYEMLKLIKNKFINFSNYIDEEQQKNILNKIDYVNIWAKNAADLTDSVTGIIKIKNK